MRGSESSNPSILAKLTTRMALLRVSKKFFKVITYFLLFLSISHVTERMLPTPTFSCFLLLLSDTQLSLGDSIALTPKVVPFMGEAGFMNGLNPEWKNIFKLLIN